MLEICFLCRFAWTHLRDFRRQLRESQLKYAYIISDKNVAGPGDSSFWRYKVRADISEDSLQKIRQRMGHYIEKP